MKVSEDFIIATLSHCIMLFILIGIMKFPYISVLICYAFGFVLPVLIKMLFNLFKYIYRKVVYAYME